MYYARPRYNGAMNYGKSFNYVLYTFSPFSESFQKPRLVHGTRTPVASRNLLLDRMVRETVA